MANYVNQEFQIYKPESNVNVPLVAQVLAMKQNTYDANKTKIQETLNAVQGLDVIRSNDKEYIANKLTDLTSQINNSGDRDLSQSFIAEDINKNIMAITNDPIIQSAIINTGKIRQYEGEVNAIKTKNPKLYSDTNYSYALDRAGVNEYLSGQTNSIGNLNYTNYIDVTETALKKIKDLKDLRGKAVIEVPDPQNPGRIMKTTIDGLTDEEIVRYIPNIITPEESQQLTINGWARYGKDINVARENLNNYRTSKTKSIEESINQSNAILNSSTASQEQKKQAQLNIDSYNREKDNLESTLSNINLDDSASIGGFLERSSWIQGIAAMGRGSQSQEFEKDDYYFAKADLERQDFRDRLALEKFNLDSQKTALENEKLRQELGLSTAVNQSPISISARESEIAQEINPFSDQRKEYIAITDQMKSLITEAVNSDRTPEDVKDHYTAELYKRGYDKNGNVIPGKEKIANAVPPSLAMKQAFDASNMAYIHGDLAKQLSGIDIKRNSVANEFGKNKTAGLVEAWDKKADAYIYRLNDLIAAANNDKESEFGISDEKANAIYGIWKEAEDFVKQNGGYDKLKESLRNNPQKLAQFVDIQEKLENRPVAPTGYIARFVGSLGNPDAAFNAIRGTNLKKDSENIANTRLREQTANKQNAYFNTQNIATISNEKVRERIINMFPQTEDTPLFNSKNPISYYKNPNGSITFIQNKGYTTGKNSVFNRPAEITVDTKDAAYQEAQKFIDLDDSKRGLDATRTSVKVKPSKNLEYISTTNKTVLGTVDASFASLPPSVTSAFSSHPASYLTKKRVQEAYSKTLNNVLPEEKITQLVNSLSTNVGKLKLEMKPYDKTWSLDVKTNRDKPIWSGDTGIKNLENDWVYLVQNYPQTIATEAVLKYVLENPEEVDALINNLEQ